MNNFDSTMQMSAISSTGDDPRSIIMMVYDALLTKGYDPVTQLTGYLISGDPTYITSFNGARSMICRLERDEIVEELVRFYLENRGK